MNLKEWKQKFDQSIEETINSYLKEKGDELVTPNPLKSKEQQLEEHRQNLMLLIHSPAADEQFRQALIIIRDQMPQTISKEEWDVIHNEFINCESHLLQVFEADAKTGNTEGGFVPIYQLCGFSVSTLSKIYAFGQSLYQKGAFSDSKLVMLCLMRLAPNVVEFWIAAAMCDKQLKNYQAAIEIYKMAQTAFPENASLYLYCADNYLHQNDKMNAQAQIDTAKSMLDQNPGEWAQWQDFYDYLTSRAK